MTFQTVWGDESAPWMHVPLAWPDPDFGVPMNFAADVAIKFGQEHGEGFRRERYLHRLLAHLAPYDGRELGGLYLWLGEPLLPPVLATLEIYETVGAVEETFPLLGHADDPGLGTEVTPAPHPELGLGSRYVRRVKTRKGVFGSAVRTEVRWVWRVRDTQDLVLTIERDDPEELARILPDVEALIATARVAPA